MRFGGRELHDPKKYLAALSRMQVRDRDGHDLRRRGVDWVLDRADIAIAEDGGQLGKLCAISRQMIHELRKECGTPCFLAGLERPHRRWSLAAKPCWRDRKSTRLNSSHVEISYA